MGLKLPFHVGTETACGSRVTTAQTCTALSNASSSEVYARVRFLPPVQFWTGVARLAHRGHSSPPRCPWGPVQPQVLLRVYKLIRQSFPQDPEPGRIKTTVARPEPRRGGHPFPVSAPFLLTSKHNLHNASSCPDFLSEQFIYIIFFWVGREGCVCTG